LANVKVEGPEGQALGFSESDGLLRVQDTTHLGVHRVEVGGQTVRFASNLHDPLESELTPRDMLEFATDPAATPEQQPRTASAGTQESWRWLVILGVVVLLAEWAGWTLRRSA
jgi:hypothetical protein